MCVRLYRYLVKKVHAMGIALGLVFGIISVLLFLYLGAQSAFPVIILWMLVPVFMKKLIVRLRRENGRNV